MSASLRQKKDGSETEIHITYEDQQKINKFARVNAKYEDCKEDIAVRKNELQNIEDAISELELADEDEEIMYREGEIFLYKTVSSAQEALEGYKNELIKITSNSEKELVNLKDQIDTLKAHLYAKFGNNIHLEMDE